MAESLAAAVESSPELLPRLSATFGSCLVAALAVGALDAAAFAEGTNAVFAAHLGGPNAHPDKAFGSKW